MKTEFAAFGGWSGATNAASDEATQKAAFDYLSYINEPAQSNVDVTIAPAAGASSATLRCPPLCRSAPRSS